jgi:putative transposase
MPRQARLDAPGTLHHVILRGLERGAIVKDEADREAFVTRLGAVARATGTSIYAWALLPNHAHLLLRSGPAGLPGFMRRLLTGYAVTFNRRHKRAGHLFQNRYKSIVCEEDAYFRELVRYLHLNPARADLAVHLVTQLGLSLADTARQLGVSTSGITKALARAERRIVH